MTSNGAECPYCGKLIEPAPSRRRKCPHCRQAIVVRRGSLYTEADAADFDEFLDDARRDRDEKKLGERMALFRENHLRDVEQYRAMGGDIVGVRIVATDDSCPHCRQQQGRVIPLGKCAANTLPPWNECTHEYGCRCFIEPVWNDKIAAVVAGGAPALRQPVKRANAKPQAGCLLGALSLVSGGLLLHWLSALG